MAKYRKIDPRIWTDEKFNSLDHEGQRFFLYLLTSPHSNACGAYVLPDLYIEADLGIPQVQIVGIWEKLIASDMVLRCRKTNLVCLPNWFRYNTPENAKSAAACIASVRSLPRSDVLTEYCKRSEWLRERLGASSLTVSERLDREPEPEPEQEPEPEPEPEFGSPSVSFPALRGRIVSFFPEDKGVENFLQWFVSMYLHPSKADGDKAVARLAEIFAQVQMPDKESPPKWFMWKVEQPSQEGGLGYSPAKKRVPGM